MFRPSRFLPILCSGIALALLAGCIQSPYRSVYRPGRTRFIAPPPPQVAAIEMPPEPTPEAAPVPVGGGGMPALPGLDAVPAGDAMGAPAGQPAPGLPGMMMQPAM